MPAVAALGVVCVLMACLLLSYAYEHTFHVLLSKVAQVFIDATWNGPFGIAIGFAFIGHALNSLDNAIRDGLYAGIQGTEWAWHQTVGQFAQLYHDLAHTVEQVSGGTLNALDWLRSNVLPEAIRLALNPVGTALAALQAQVEQLLHRTQPVVHDATKVIYRDVPQALTKAEQAAIAAQVVVPAAVTKVIAIPQAGIDYVGREAGALRRRVDELAKRLAPSALGGVVAASVLGTLGLGWLKCSNVGRVGRRVCGLDSRILDGLLAGLVAVLGGIGLLWFAAEVQAVGHEFSVAVRGFWKSAGQGPGGDRALGQVGHGSPPRVGASGPGGDRALGQPGN
jgi:hypothetical protein